MRIYYTIFILTVFSRTVFAQVFPVQVNTQIFPPYTPYLSDYTAPGAQKLMVQLRANDLTLTDYRVKLRITIEGVNITIRTKQSFIPQQPIILQGGGVPQLYYGEDLEAYFNPNALDFAGITRSQYEKGAKLPEGLYRFTIEVLDYNRGTVVSNRGTSMAWVILNDPPVLNLPRNDTKVRILDPTNIVFNWTPRHTGSPNSAFSTEYIFRLVEVWPLNRNPYDAFLTQPVLYEVATSQTQLIYGLAEPALLPGRKYAWQVQAKDLDDKDLFKNQGRSEVYVFQFGDALGVPENIKREGGNASTLSISWEPAPHGEMPLEYRVRYRKKGTGNGGEWYETTTTQRWVTLSSLQSSTDYEVQVRAEAKPQVSAYSLLQSMRTEDHAQLPYSCGSETIVPPTENSRPLLVLTAGDVITSRNFRFVVTEATGSNGFYTGKGVVQIPFFNNANVNVIFSHIQLNDKYELVNGELVTTYNPGSELSQKIEEAHKIGEEKPEQQGAPADSAVITPEVIYTIPGTIDSIWVDDEGVIVVVDEDGNETTYEQPVDEVTQEKQPVQVTDSAGNSYTIDKDGKVKKDSSSGASANTVAVSPASLNILKEIIMSLRAEYTDEKIRSIDEQLNLASGNLDGYLESKQMGFVLESGAIPSEIILANFEPDDATGEEQDNSDFDKLSVNYKQLEWSYNIGNMVRWIANNLDNQALLTQLAQNLDIGNQNTETFIQQNFVQQQEQEKRKGDAMNELKQSVLKYMTRKAYKE